MCPSIHGKLKLHQLDNGRQTSLHAFGVWWTSQYLFELKEKCPNSFQCVVLSAFFVADRSITMTRRTDSSSYSLVRMLFDGGCGFVVAHKHTQAQVQCPCRWILAFVLSVVRTTYWYTTSSLYKCRRVIYTRRVDATDCRASAG
jgi:hypothetical protein